MPTTMTRKTEDEFAGDGDYWTMTLHRMIWMMCKYAPTMKGAGVEDKQRNEAETNNLQWKYKVHECPEWLRWWYEYLFVLQVHRKN